MHKHKNKLVTSAIIIGSFLIGVFVMWTARNYSAVNTSEHNSEHNSVIRQGGYRLINPILFTYDGDDTRGYEPLRKKVQEYITSGISDGKLKTASVYFRAHDEGQWFGINSEEDYHPASLLKVPTMIAFLKEAELNPAVLQKEILYQERSDHNSQESIRSSRGIEDGKTYTIDELLSYMILYSDNNATKLLHQNIDRQLLSKVYTDPGLSIPQHNDPVDFMSAKQYSYFFRILYNATYLNRELSEKALNLLSRTDFSQGLVAGIPVNINVAHKFGETTVYGQQEDKEKVVARELHDCGIIYYPDDPYLLCIMTKGSDFDKLLSIIRDISHIVYAGYTVGK